NDPLCCLAARRSSRRTGWPNAKLGGGGLGQADWGSAGI
ncbi:uncharacterized protein METZ01_LOCUS281816, partial [marine metagenome]